MVAILLIGDEILSASVREANLHLMLTRLVEIGYEVGEVRIVRDEPAEIAGAFRALRERYEYVLSAGGIGPTHDDMTLAAAAEAFGARVERNGTMLAFLKTRYGEPLSPMVAQMADLPEATEVLGCEEGRWPLIRWNNVFILPGLPRALEDKMSRLVAVLPQRDHTWQAELYLSADESVFADWLAGVQTTLEGVAVGSYPVTGDYDYRSRLVLRGLDRERVRSALAALREHVSSAGWLVREGGDA